MAEQSNGECARLEVIDGRVRRVETQMASIASEHVRVMATLYGAEGEVGGGVEGLLTKIDTRLEEREKREIARQNDRERFNNTRLGVLALVFTMITILVDIFGPAIRARLNVPTSENTTPFVIQAQPAPQVTENPNTK